MEGKHYTLTFVPLVLGKLGPGQSGPKQLGPGQLALRLRPLHSHALLLVTAAQLTQLKGKDTITLGLA